LLESHKKAKKAWIWPGNSDQLRRTNPEKTSTTLNLGTVQKLNFVQATLLNMLEEACGNPTALQIHVPSDEPKLVEASIEGLLFTFIIALRCQSPAHCTFISKTG
jgi:multidrug efflux pump subunit AcrB